MLWRICGTTRCITLLPSSRRARDQRLDLVDEDDRARHLLRLLEEALDVLLGLTDPLAEDVGGRDDEEAGVDLAGRRAGEHRLPRAWRPVEQHAAASADAEALGQFRVGERVEHLQLDVSLHVIEPRHVVEAQRRLLAHQPLIGGGLIVTVVAGRFALRR
jgi:hypothetical protein